MKEQTALKKVAEMARLADSYVSAWGDEAKVSDETLRRLLTSLGYDTSSDEKLLASAEKKHKKDVLAPVLCFTRRRTSRSGTKPRYECS